MARAPMKYETGFPMLSALGMPSDDVPSSQVGVQQEPTPVSALDDEARVRPIPASALEGLGMLVVGMVQIAIEGKSQVVPVGLAPYAGSDTMEVPRAGFFIDEDGHCGILLNGNDSGWQQALPLAVEEARRALGGAAAS